ncbi:MAG: dockerin type I repeat-containing protein, partial [Firmicutes bacterium]|nr:dockerin type I repeat-containing protein [Bacillota bacterium]
VANANERTHLNKSLIYDEIDRTNKMREEKYIAEYFSKEFEECDKVIATADSILLDDELTNEKIKAKADELKEKNDIISESGSYKLLRAIDAAENIKYSAYTNITWDNLQNALKKGNELKDTETNDEKLKNAAQSIYECIDALEKKTEGTVKLAWYLDMRDKENKFDYNDEDWANFKSEIASARKMIYEREDISEEEYNSIKKKIDDIYENIRKPYMVETVYYRDFENKNNESPNYGNSKQEYGNETSFSKHASSYPFQITTEKGTNFIGTYQLEFSFYEENVNSGILVGFPYKNLYITDEGISQNEWHRMRIDFDSYSKDVYVSIDGKPEVTKMNFYETQYDDYNDIELMMNTAGSSIRCIDDIVLKEKILRTNTPNDSSWGDVDLDGKVTANDAALVQNYLSGKILLSDEQKYNASVLGIDNDITSGCAVRILEQVYDNSLKKTIDDRPYTDPKYLTTTESTSETTTESTSETTIASINEIDDLDIAKIPTGDHSEDYIQGNFTIGREFSVEKREAVYKGVDFPFTDKGKVFYKAIKLKGNSDTENADSYIKVNVSNGERLTLTYIGTDGKYAPYHVYLSENGELNEIESSYIMGSNGLIKIFYADICSGEYIITFSKDVFVYDVAISELSDEISGD